MTSELSEWKSRSKLLEQATSTNELPNSHITAHRWRQGVLSRFLPRSRFLYLSWNAQQNTLVAVVMMPSVRPIRSRCDRSVGLLRVNCSSIDLDLQLAPWVRVVTASSPSRLVCFLLPFWSFWSSLMLFSVPGLSRAIIGRFPPLPLQAFVWVF